MNDVQQEMFGRHADKATNRDWLRFPRSTIYLLVILLLASCNHDAPGTKFFSGTPIYFKVQDQDGLPVTNVELDITHGGNSFYTGSNSGWGKYLADANGVIEVRVDERKISLDRIRAKGYDINLRKILYYYFRTRDYTVPAQGDLWPNEWGKFGIDTPFVIQAWRIDEKERVAQCKNGKIAKQLRADGRLYGIDFQKKGKATIVDSDPLPLFQVSFERDLKMNIAEGERVFREDIFAQEWQYELRLIHGGIVEIDRDELFMKTPPLSGYARNWSLNNESFRQRENYLQNSKHVDERHFYLKIDGQYARMDIRFSPIGRDSEKYPNGGIHIRYSINVDGENIVQGIDGYESPLSSSKQFEVSCVDNPVIFEERRRIYPLIQY